MESPRVLTAREVAGLVGGELLGPADIQLAGVAPLDRARPGEISLLSSSRYLPQFQRTGASAVLLSPGLRGASGGPATRIVVENPRAAVQTIMGQMYPPAAPGWGIDRSAKLAAGVRWIGRISVGPGAMVGKHVELGRECVIEPGAVIGDGVRVGHRCTIGSYASIAPGAMLGDEVVIKAGARVGGAGFGFVGEDVALQHVTHVGRCLIGDGVEIGSNSTVDRGSMGDTVIGAGTKIDNLVHVAHNVRVGERCLVMAQVGIAGSSSVGDEAILAGQAGLADHLHVGSGARVAAQGGVIGDIEPGATVSGYPARSHREVLRQAAALRRLTPLVARLEQLARREDHVR